MSRVFESSPPEPPTAVPAEFIQSIDSSAIDSDERADKGDESAQETTETETSESSETETSEPTETAVEETSTVSETPSLDSVEEMPSDSAGLDDLVSLDLPEEMTSEKTLAATDGTSTSTFTDLPVGTDAASTDVGTIGILVQPIENQPPANTTTVRIRVPIPN